MGEAMAGLSAKELGINLDLYTTGAINDPTTSEYAEMFLDGGSGEIESEKDEDEKDENKINGDNYDKENDSTWDTIVGSRYASMAISALDRKIAIDIESVLGTTAKASANEIARKLK